MVKDNEDVETGPRTDPRTGGPDPGLPSTVGPLADPATPIPAGRVVPQPGEPDRPEGSIVVDRIAPHERLNQGVLGVPAPDVLQRPVPAPERPKE